MNESAKHKNFLRYCGTALLFVVLVFSGLHSSADTWRAGAAYRDITPSQAMWTAGYGGRKLPAEGRVNDLKVKALAIEDPSGSRFVLVTCDIWGFTYEFSSSVTERAGELYGLSREQILLNASHTHCGPDIRPIDGINARVFNVIPDEYESRIRPYSAWLEDRFVETIGEALNNLEPAVISFSSSRPVPFAVSRRFPDGQGGVIYRSSPSSYYTEGERDDIVPVLRVADKSGNIRAVAFGYACHPITLNEDRFSSDYPGFAQQYVEEAFPGAVALFVQGCSAELVPNSRFQIEYAMGQGRALALAVRQAVEGRQTPLEGPLSYAYEEVELRFEPLNLEELRLEARNPERSTGRKAAWILDRLERGEEVSTTLPCPVHVVNFGKNMMMVAFGGETAVDYSVAVKNRYSDKFVWAAGYSNYVFSYLPSLRVLREGGYEGSERLVTTAYPGPFAECVEERVLAGVERLVKKSSE